MANCDEYIIKYHHGGSLVREGESKYINGRVDEFAVDPDKICYWDFIGDLKDLGYDIKKTLKLFYIDEGGTLNSIFDDSGVVGLVDQLIKKSTVDIYVESFGANHGNILPEELLHGSHNTGEMQRPGNNDNIETNENNKNNESGSESDNDEEERLVHVPFLEYNSDPDDEREETRTKVGEYVQLKDTLQGDDGQSNDAGDNVGPSSDIGKVSGYESGYISSSDPGSYIDTSEGSDADDARRHSSSRKKIYDPNAQLEDFCLDMRFQDLNSFKKELVEFSTRKGFEFKYIKNDAVRVRAGCSAKECKWLILCSWCSAREMFTVKHYVPEHSCLLAATKNKRVTAQVIARRFGDVIIAMPFIRARHLRAMVRKELGVFITYKVCRNAKSLVIKEWSSSAEGPLLVPTPKRMPGRPRKKRKCEALESKNKKVNMNQTILSRVGRVFKCKVCKREGHNKRSCPYRVYAHVNNNNDNPHKTGEKEKQKRIAIAKGRRKRGASCYGPMMTIRTQDENLTQQSTTALEAPAPSTQQSVTAAATG